MRELAKLQDMECDKIKSLISLCLELNQDNNFIISKLIEKCNLTKEDAETCLELYNEGEL